MHDPPEREALLFAVAEFLMNDVKPLLTDPRLSFRALIAANLAQIVAAELRREHEHDAAELARLQMLLPGEPLSDEERVDPTARRRAIERLSRALVERLRAGAMSDDEEAQARRATLETLRDKLSVNNPLFDTRLDLPETA
jgi:hypothetical protein